MWFNLFNAIQCRGACSLVLSCKFGLCNVSEHHVGSDHFFMGRKTYKPPPRAAQLMLKLKQLKFQKHKVCYGGTINHATHGHPLHGFTDQCHCWKWLCCYAQWRERMTFSLSDVIFLCSCTKKRSIIKLDKKKTDKVWVKCQVFKVKSQVNGSSPHFSVDVNMVCGVSRSSPAIVMSCTIVCVVYLMHGTFTLFNLFNNVVQCRS